MKIWIVDAFATKPFQGNPAAVTIVEDFPDERMCHHIASEMNLSETAFVKPLGENHFHIRWFTPTTEVKLCGHATMASAHILWEHDYAQRSPIKLESLSGPLHVYPSSLGITLDFPLQAVTDSLPIKPFQELFAQPVLHVVQAYDDVIVEVDGEDALNHLTIDFNQMLQIDCRGIIVTTKSQSPGFDFKSRFFAPRVGVNEDPVTGSAHCKLADYWHKKTGKTTFRAYQASKRGGSMTIEILGQERVHLTSQAVTVLDGVMRI